MRIFNNLVFLSIACVLGAAAATTPATTPVTTAGTTTAGTTTAGTTTAGTAAGTTPVATPVANDKEITDSSDKIATLLAEVIKLYSTLTSATKDAFITGALKTKIDEITKEIEKFKKAYEKHADAEFYKYVTSVYESVKGGLSGTVSASSFFTLTNAIIVFVSLVVGVGIGIATGMFFKKQ